MSPDNNSQEKFKPTSLKNAPVVTVWRRVGSLGEAKAFVDKTLNWKKIGEDNLAVMYDAGSTLVGYGVQLPAELEKTVIGTQKAAIPQDVAKKGGQVNLRLLAADACSAQILKKIDLVSNPATRFQVVPSNFTETVKTFNANFKVNAATVTKTDAQLFSFIDESGSFYSYIKPKPTALTGKVKTKVTELLKTNKTLETQQFKGSPLLSIELLVSNLAKSNEFYSKTLGLPLISKTKDSLQFDLKTIILTLRQETTAGLVKKLGQSGRFSEDWIVFYVPNVRDAAEGLALKGVKFPSGLERSGVGEMAYFFDPDGYPLTIWQPSGKVTNINFYPSLNRILGKKIF